MLGVFSNSAPNGVDKSLGLAKTLAKKGFESLSADKDDNLVLYLTPVLLPLEQGGIVQKHSRKRNSVWAYITRDSEVISALLEEIVTLQVSFTSINVWEPRFQRPLIWAFIIRSGGNDGGQN